LYRFRVSELFGAPVEFRPYLFYSAWQQKTRVRELSCGVGCVILHITVLVEYRLVKDEQTHDDGIYRDCLFCYSISL